MSLLCPLVAQNAEMSSDALAPEESGDTENNRPRYDGLKVGMSQEGEASYYADKFHGKLTASGVPFDMHAMTAAHKTLPFGTTVSVTNLRNGKRLEVRINDRGPFIPGRIIDVSKRAGKLLDMTGSGVVPVKIVILSLPPERKSAPQIRTEAPVAQGTQGTQGAQGDQTAGEIPTHRRFAIQIASYSQLKYARKNQERLEKWGIPIHFEKHGKYYRLIIIHLNQEQVEFYRMKLAGLGIQNILVRQE
ncbi:MAG: septal ring lytic transglycosylase RlpA family protein [Spirochaetota bacterium]